MKLYFNEFTVDEFGAWANLCNHHVAVLEKINSNNKNITKDSGEGTCSVNGCLNHATSYLNLEYTKSVKGSELDEKNNITLNRH